MAELYQNTDWIKENVPNIKYCNWFYNFICFCLGKRKTKMTYEELYVLVYGLNKNKFGTQKAKEHALYFILDIYKDLNNKYPKGFEI